MKKNTGLMIGIAGVLMGVISLFLPFAKQWKESYSMVGMAKLYALSNSADWNNDKEAEMFYKIFVPAAVALIFIFMLIYLIKCIKMKTAGMVVFNILTIAVYEIMKWDFADRRVIPGACEKGIAFTFIYIAFGGLVRQGRPDAFPSILKKAINNARICSNDPVCIMSHGQGRESLNLAACHTCALLPETCCEERNAFLDRGMIVGTFENKSLGFWNDID